MRALALSLALWAGGLHAETLTLDAYLGQVRKDNPQLRAMKAQDVALSLAAREPETAYSPQLKAQAQVMNDQLEPALAAFSPEKTQSSGYNVGLSKLFSTGTFVGLDYKNDTTELTFPAGGFIGAMPATTGHQWGLTLSQSLWRNFNASEVKAGILQAKAGADSARAASRYGAQAVLFQARNAYVQLETTRQVLALQEESLTRNAKILEWTKQKQADNLADKVDVLQVEAAVRLVALGLASSRQAEAEASARFNALRGLEPGAATGELEPLSLPQALPAPSGDRADVEAARQALRSSDAMVETVVQRFTPDLSVFAQLSANERDTDGGKAFTGVADGKHPQSLVGIKLTANLDRGLLKEVLSGAEQAKGAGQAQIDDKKLTLAQDWKQLDEQWKGLQARLSLAQELEKLQGEKAEREKTRYRDGRTTNFQVLRFEDDYSLARIQILQLLANARVLEAQARFYNGDDQPW
jgi:outer membrane protein TolC